jgi:hypothetical protein
VLLSNAKRHRRNFPGILAAATVLLACGADDGNEPPGTGTGGNFSTGGAMPASGGVSAGAGGAATGGGGVTNSGGGGAATNSGGTPATGGVTGAGGAANGGAFGTGGASTGGAIGATGGTTATGGASSGGTTATGGASSGGAGSCEFPAPPADVAEWIDQSWNAQLGNNIRSRKAWNLDHIIHDKGEINVCVRWGATSTVPEAVRMNVAATTERWFNDWFKGLGDYGCFPYAAGIKVKVTGWAVRPGQQSLLGGISGVPIYTETDGEGEPKCPDNCSEFVHWDHQFPNCPGGAANHHDYWLWFDDDLPGGGGAAAVGGDWGLRMPVRTFVNAFNNPSYLVVEHEMGHGFGFQDYYDWTGARPRGGSIMIVGSTSGSQAPSTADIWLLRRTWKEMKTLRGW